MEPSRFDVPKSCAACSREFSKPDVSVVSTSGSLARQSSAVRVSERARP